MNVLKKLLRSSADNLGTQASGSQPSLRILLAEDCETTSLTIKEMLQRYGYDVTVAPNGNDALRTLKRTSFDYALLNLEMSALNGFEICRRLRSEFSEGMLSLPVIGISDEPSPLLSKVATQIGIDHVLEKPIDFDRLTGILRSLKKKSADSADKRSDTIDQHSEQAVLAKRVALERLAGSEDLYESLLRKLRDMLPHKKESIASAVLQNDFRTIEIITHSLASSLGAVGAQQSMLEAKTLCLCARLEDTEAVRSCFQALSDALEKLTVCLEEELK